MDHRPLSPASQPSVSIRLGGARAAMASWVLAVWLASSPSVQAGRQAEEPLANAVRTALSAAVNNASPPVPVFADDAQKRQYEQWLSRAEQRLAKRPLDPMVRRELLQTVWYEAKRARLDPTMVLGLIEVESGFRQHAISSAGARGLMQVMPFWARLIGHGDASVLFHRQANIRFGCVILRHYMDIERDNVFMALGRYNGSRGRAEYPNLVTAAWNRWHAQIHAPQMANVGNLADAGSPARR